MNNLTVFLTSALFSLKITTFIIFSFCMISCQKDIGNTYSSINTIKEFKDSSVSNRGASCGVCPNLIINPDITVDVNLCIPPDNGARSFKDGAVEGWSASYRTPHHVAYLYEEPCTRNPLSAGYEIHNCISATVDNNNNEGIYTDVDIINDPDYIYCIDMDIFNICTEPLEITTKVAIRFANDIPFSNQNPTSSNHGGYEYYLLGEVEMNNYENTNVSYIVTPYIDFPGKSYESMEMFAYDADINSGSISFSNVSLQCYTSDLIDIEVTDNGNCEMIFTPVFNSKTFNFYPSMQWDFGDGSPQINASGPSIVHHYNQEGTYRLRLVVTDINNCCAIASKDINCDIPTCDFYLCWSTNYWVDPDGQCPYTNCTDELSMQLFEKIKGFEVLHNGVWKVFDLENYPLPVNGLYNELWTFIKGKLNSEYEIPFASFYETDPDDEVSCWKGNTLIVDNFFLDNIPTGGQNGIQGIRISGYNEFDTPIFLDFYTKNCN